MRRRRKGLPIARSGWCAVDVRTDAGRINLQTQFGEFLREAAAVQPGCSKIRRNPLLSVDPFYGLEADFYQLGDALKFYQGEVVELATIVIFAA